MPRPTDSTFRAPVLIAHCADGSPRSPLEDEVTGLFDRFREPMLRYLLSIGLSPQDSDEVIQEVFLSLFQHLRCGKPRHNLRGWIFCVAHNLALKHRYRRSPHLAAGPEETLAQIQDRYPNPEEAWTAKQRQTRLLAVVRALPEQDRSCLPLRAEGLRYREIAKVLGISLGSVSLSLVRSLARLSRADIG